MPKRFSTAQFFLTGGGLLAILGLLLWRELQIPSDVPPYLVTALLALAYGLFCWGRSRRAGSGKREVETA